MTLPAHPTDADRLAFFRSLKPSAIVNLLGFRVVSVDSATRSVRSEYHATTQMLNAIGSVQGGLVTAMIDQGMTAAALAMSDFRAGFPTLEIKTSFMAAAKPGLLYVDGRVVRQGKSILFLEGDLRDAQGELLAKASSTTRTFERPLIDVW